MKTSTNHIVTFALDEHQNKDGISISDKINEIKGLIKDIRFFLNKSNKLSEEEIERLRPIVKDKIDKIKTLKAEIEDKLPQFELQSY